MGCGSSTDRPAERPNPRRRKRKERDVGFSNIEDTPAPAEKGASKPAETPDAKPANNAPPMSLEAKKLSINPAAASTVPRVEASQPAPQQQQAQTQPNAPAPQDQQPARPLTQAPITGTIDPGKKVTLRQTVQLAIQIAKQQREKIGKFRRDERHSVMELYELMGLENDAPIAPQSEYQAQLASYNYPPDNMHMLRDVDVVDESTIICILGEKEFSRRKNEGTVEIGPPSAKTGSVAPRRAGVSAEVKKDQSYSDNAALFKNLPKTEAQTAALALAMKRTILFRGLDTHEMKMLFDAFECEEFPENSVIFEKGDDGDRFYLIETGRCQIVLSDDDGTEVGHVFVGDGDTFGELGVMYGTPRAATVVSVLPTATWWIDRDTYRGLLLMQTVRKRDRFKKFLKSIDIFSSINDYERARIADVLDVMEVGPGTTIVSEGDAGDTFYMIEEGQVEVVTKSAGVVIRLGPGKYFGELALLFDKPRQASVRAVTDVRMCCLGRANFANYLGPFENILRRNADQYRRVLQAAM
jgi:cAMP-dependent protein kinase regulator